MKKTVKVRVLRFTRAPATSDRADLREKVARILAPRWMADPGTLVHRNALDEAARIIALILEARAA